MMREMVYLPEQIQMNCSMGVTYAYSIVTGGLRFAGYDDIRATPASADSLFYWRTQVSGAETDTFIRIKE